MTTTPTYWGSEVTFSFDTTAYGTRVTALNDGTFAITWQNSTDVFGTHYDELGASTAGNFLSGASSPSNDVYTPILTQQEDGTVLVHYGYAFSSSDQDILVGTPNSDFTGSSSGVSVLASVNGETLLDATAREGGGGAIAYNYTVGITTNLALRFTDSAGQIAGSQILIDSSATRAEMDPAIVSRPSTISTPRPAPPASVRSPAA